MYTDNKADVTLRKNISFIAKDVWESSNDQLKFKIGVKLESFRLNMQQSKLERGKEFLSVVDGHTYETLSTKIIIIEDNNEKLIDAHMGWDNFYNEPTYIREILKYIKKSEDIPQELQADLIKTILRCRIGKGISYKKGVSPSGKDLYNNFFSLLGDNAVKDFIKALFSIEIKPQLSNPICRTHVLDILKILRINIISERKKEALDFLINNIDSINKSLTNKEFKDICQPFLTWN